MKPQNTDLSGRNLAVVYDCLYPWTIGGQEQWFADLARDLVQRGASLSYVTRRQWDDDEPVLEGIIVEPVSPDGPLYGDDGTRRLLPTVQFGWGTFVYFAKNRRRHDAVVIASFPFFSLIAAWLALLGTGTPLIVSWVECWTKSFWISYGGALTGRLGYVLQRLCIAITPCAIAESTFVARRLRSQGLRSEPRAIPGLLPDHVVVPETTGAPTHLLFSGRHISDKGVDLLPEIFTEVHRAHPELPIMVTSDGPLSNWLKGEITRAGLDEVVTFTGFVDPQQLAKLTASAVCVVLPSRREGFGILAGTAPAFGTPVVVGAFEENAAIDLIDEGINGYIADPPTPQNFAAAVLRAIDEGPELRQRAKHWFATVGQQKTMAAANALVATTVASQLARR